MKKALLLVSSSIFVLGSALAAAPMFTNTTAPEQSFRSVNTVSPAMTAQPETQPIKANSNNTGAAAMAKVKAIMAAAKRQVQAQSAVQNKQPVQPVQPEQTVQPVSQPVSVLNNPTMASTNAGTVQSQVATLNRNTQLIQQSMLQQFSVLYQKNNELQMKLNMMTHALASLNQQVISMNNGGQGAAGQSSLQQFLKNNLTYAVYLTLAALIVLILLMLFRRQSNAVVATVPAASAAQTKDADDDTSAEYDFLGSDEGIPAKLDLARAYIAMEDFAAAKTALNEVLKDGNQEQKAQAQTMMQQMPAGKAQ